jgi:hypothetical protein
VLLCVFSVGAFPGRIDILRHTANPSTVQFSTSILHSNYSGTGANYRASTVKQMKREGDNTKM